jgi:diaminopimelate decarboxylase
MKSRHYSYRAGVFHVEGVSIEALAKKWGTPLYVYSRADIEDRFDSYEKAFQPVQHLVCFALKANPNLAVARVLARRGAGADVVSAGELRRALLAGFAPSKIIFSGVGKTEEELAFAIRSGIRLINVESQEELIALSRVAAKMKKPAAFSLRVNPDVRAGGHPHISTGTPENKFGVHYKNIFPLYQWAMTQPYLRAVGIQSHIGSQITRVGPYKRAVTVLVDLVESLRNVGVHLEIIDLGGGLGVDYNGENPDTPADLAKMILPPLQKHGLTLFLEPGRSLIAQAGLLVTSVLYRKDAGRKHFVIVDAAMNDLARPALYDAYHEIVFARKRAGKAITVDVVGPVCESGDYLARGREMVLPHQGDRLAVLTAGAYGFAMSSQYNARPRSAEVLVSGRKAELVRSRETFKDLIRGEKIPRSLA